MKLTSLEVQTATPLVGSDITRLGLVFSPHKALYVDIELGAVEHEDLARLFEDLALMIRRECS